MIFFDIDGTLLDHAAAEQQAAIRFAQNQNLDYTSEEAFVAQWRVASERHMDRYLKDDISFREQRRFRLQDIIGRELDPSEAASLFSIYLQAYESNWHLFKDVLPCLNRLNQPLGIITNGNRDQQIRKLQQTGIAKYFSTVITSEDIEVSKPDAKIFQAACVQASVSATDCIYVGDRLTTDAIGAVQSEWQGIWLNRCHSLEYVPPGVVNISTLDELMV